MRKTLLILFPIFFAAFSLKAQEIIGTNDTTICHGSPAELHAQLINGSYGTSSYTFEQYAYSPELYDDPSKTQVPFSQPDDDVKGPFNIGFNFCFFNQIYSQFWVGSNGWVGFQSNSNTWQPVAIPNPAAPRNCIMAPWQDWYPGSGTNSVVYYYVKGTAPNRKLVVYWNNSKMYGCHTGPGELPLGKFQIVLNEQSSIVENHLTNKPYCQDQGNAATQGVQNAAATVAFTATGRNFTSWTTSNESTRFVPSGIKWYTGGYPGGTVVGYGPVLNVSPTVTTTYTVVVETCEGGGAITKNITVTVIHCQPPMPDLI